jgi:Mg2+-importing ATPase
MRFTRNLTVVLGPVSSVFDFLTFGLLLLVFQAGEALFRTGWFI